MLQSYLIVAFRNLVKHKSFSLINILGLSIGMPVCLLVILVVSGQKDLDQFHEKRDRIFRVITTVTEPSTGNQDDVATAPGPVSPLMAAEIPDVEDAVRLLGFASTVRDGENLTQVEGYYAEQSFFSIFSHPLVSGDPMTALKDPFSAVISEELGRKLFGDEDPMGRVIAVANGDVRVTGILKKTDGSGRSHIDREMLISFSTLESVKRQLGSWADPLNWESPSRFYHYVLLRNPEDAATVERAIPALLKRVERPDARLVYECRLQPLTGIAFGPELLNQIGRVMEGPVLYIFLIVAVVVMVPVLFNYISLTVARSLKRSREVGIRKVVGAHRRHVIFQIILESVTVALIAVLPSALILDLLLPAFNGFQFVDYISADWISDWRIYAFFVVFGVGAGCVAGILPAIVLSSIRPASALKGLTRMPGFSGITLRKVFLVIQFTLSLLFIVLTTIFHRQLAFMLNADYGFDKEHVVAVVLQYVPFSLFRNEAVRQPGVIEISASSDFIGRSNPEPDFRIRSASLAEPIGAVNFAVSPNYLTSLNFSFVAGRDFSELHAADSSASVVINETAARRLGFADASAAIGQVVTLPGNVTKQIVGVTADFHYARLQNSIDPVILEYDPARLAFAMVRVAPGMMLRTVTSIEELWPKLSADPTPMRYRFLNDYVLGAYNDMKEITVFISIIAGLAIAISCLGLLGMAIYSTETRVKEIGVRKVFGATASGIVLLLSRDLVKLLAISALLAAPLLWMFVNFMFFRMIAFRIELDAGIFLYGFFLVLGPALLTIGSQTIRSANGNPVDALRSE